MHTVLTRADRRRASSCNVVVDDGGMSAAEGQHEEGTRAAWKHGSASQITFAEVDEMGNNKSTLTMGNVITRSSMVVQVVSCWIWPFNVANGLVFVRSEIK